MIPVTRLALLAVLALSPGVLTAQGSDSAGGESAPSPRGLGLGGTVDRYLVGGESYTAISFRGVTFKPEGWSPEFAFGVLPPVGDDGPVALTTDLGTAYGIPMPATVLLLKAGSTGIFGLSGGGALVGAYGGAGVVALLGGGVGLRFEATRRWYLVPGRQPAVWVLSLGLTSMPLRR